MYSSILSWTNRMAIRLKLSLTHLHPRLIGSHSGRWTPRFHIPHIFRIYVEEWCTSSRTLSVPQSFSLNNVCLINYPLQNIALFLLTIFRPGSANVRNQINRSFSRARLKLETLHKKCSVTVHLPSTNWINLQNLWVLWNFKVSKKLICIPHFYNVCNFPQKIKSLCN